MSANFGILSKKFLPNLGKIRFKYGGKRNQEREVEGGSVRR